MAKRKEINVFNIAFLDLLSGALGAVIILYIAVPKSKQVPSKSPESKVESLVQKKQEAPEVNARKIIRENIELESKLTEYSKQMQELQSKMQELQQTNRTLAQVVEEKEKKEKESAKVEKINGSLDADVGFKFQGKKIVFVIDVSGSMYKEDRIGQVKAGLKMLITSMGRDFAIDVVQYPYGMYATHRPLWNNVRKMTIENKMQVYQFLHELKPFGSTPTRDVMKYVLKNYQNATDIVLLSDGAPTKLNSKSFENIASVLVDLNRSNKKRVQINTVGVGSDFLTNTSNPKYKFLKRLSEMHNGFFVGF